MKIEDILIMTEHELRQFIILKLKAGKIPHTVTEDYIFTHNEGVLPLICVHTDIVGNVPPTAKQIIKFGSILAVKKGARVLGADDRAGVFIALNLLHRQDFNFAFFAQEEVGGKGSTQFALKEDLDQYSAFIGLDRASRHGKQNIATYGYDNDDLISLFGFPESYGSMCDASVLSGYCDIACVNLSVGYEHEHTNKEILDLELMNQTLQVMQELVVPDEVYTYEIKTKRDWGYTWDFKPSVKNYDPVVCDNCGLPSILYTVDGMYVCEYCIEEVEEAYFIEETTK
jgi:hypothetical protein